MTLNHQQLYLPRGWAWAKVDDICDAVNGKAFKPSDWSRQGTPIVRIQNLRDETAEYNYFEGEYDRRFEVTAGDLLFAWSGTPGTSFGAHIWKGPRAVLNQHIFNIRFDQESIVPVFLQEGLNQNVADYVRQAQGGVGLAHITKTKFMASHVLFAPLREQRRIVAEIEKQFTRLDASVAALQRTQANLKRYRASVLRSACSGELVATEAELARAEGREYEPADVLLEHVLAERRARWEAQEKRRGKYKEPAAPDASNLPPLPEGWAWATLAQLGEVRLGRQRSPKRATGPNMRSYMRAANVTWGGLDLSDVKEMDFTPAEYETYGLLTGDILLSEASGTADEVGKPAVWNGEVDGCCFQNTLIRVRAESELVPYLFHHLLSDARTGALGRAARGVGIHHLGAQRAETWVVGIPPLAEQHRIVAEVERRLSVIQQAAAAVVASLQRAERLRQSILKRAFSGRLVPQDPDDEPASVLLERIRTQREAEQAAGSATKKRPARRRRAQAQQRHVPRRAHPHDHRIHHRSEPPRRLPPTVELLRRAAERRNACPTETTWSSSPTSSSSR